MCLCSKLAWVKWWEHKKKKINKELTDLIRNTDAIQFSDFKNQRFYNLHFYLVLEYKPKYNNKVFTVSGWFQLPECKSTVGISAEVKKKKKKNEQHPKTAFFSVAKLPLLPTFLQRVHFVFI